MLVHISAFVQIARQTVPLRRFDEAVEGEGAGRVQDQLQRGVRYLQGGHAPRAGFVCFLNTCESLCVVDLFEGVQKSHQL